MRELQFYQVGVPTKECFSCTCTVSWDAGITDLVYDCEQLLRATHADEWEEFQCPPMTCQYSIANQGPSIYPTSPTTRPVQDIWFEQVANTTQSDRFCYCAPNQGAICETGWANIMANDVLLNRFREECGYDQYTIGVE